MKKLLLLLALSSSLSLLKAQYTDLINFTGLTGSYIGQWPLGSLTLSGDTLYGMTWDEGRYGYGNIFSVQTNGTDYKDLGDFTGTSGSYIGVSPSGSLTLSGDTLYGMTYLGGIYAHGNIFSVQTNGMNFKDLIDFTGTSGSYIGGRPWGSLTLSGNTLYGMTEAGGINGNGNIFSVQTNGTNYRDLIDFSGTSGSFIGANPYGSLTLSGGTLYGMTEKGGINGDGNIFSAQTNGASFNDLIDFTGDTGSYIGYAPFGSLTLSGDTLYGMTWAGYGNIFSVQTNGTNFKNLVDFTGTSGSYIGEDPFGDLTLSGGTLYGMTASGGIHGYGNIFSVKTNGTNYKDLIDFTDTSGSYIGAHPEGSLTLFGDTLYGMTSDWPHANEYGNIFSLNYRTLSVNPLSAGSGQVKVYPNPNNGIFTLSLSHAELVSASQTIEIYNVLGEQVYFEILKQVQGDYTVNLSNQPNGVYLYRVLSVRMDPSGKNGELIGEGKLVVQH
jgi:hypothetical protein